MDCISFANGRLFGCCRALPWAGLSRSSATFLYFEKKVILSYIPEAAFRTAAYGFIAVSAMLAVMPLTLLTADVPPRYPRRRAARRLPCKLLAACALACRLGLAARLARRLMPSPCSGLRSLPAVARHFYSTKKSRGSAFCQSPAISDYFTFRSAV